MKILKAMRRQAHLEEYTTDAWLRQHFGEISARRGTPDHFDRFESHSIVFDGLSLHTDIIEVDRQRPTLVFMPGTNAYAMLYGDFLTALADRGYNVIGFDPRGHGRSEGARGSYTVSELVADMRSVVSYAGERFDNPVFAAGSSQGGITAFYLAAAVAKRSKGLPAAVQVVGPAWREDIVLSVMSAVEAHARTSELFPRTPLDPIRRHNTGPESDPGAVRSRNSRSAE